jgi:hypothetical protein
MVLILLFQEQEFQQLHLVEVEEVVQVDACMMMEMVVLEEELEEIIFNCWCWHSKSRIWWWCWNAVGPVYAGGGGGGAGQLLVHRNLEVVLKWRKWWKLV